MRKNEIVNYQFGERIKSAMIICSKMLAVVESLGEGRAGKERREGELAGAKKVLGAFFDGLSVETGMALRATGMREFGQVEEELAQARRRVEAEAVDFEEVQASLGRAVSHATTACDRAVRALAEEGLL
ncbi:hypothetical protein B6V00_03265 [ANME-1 cluster archaeon ex4572_4]|nr:hypothetical protein [Methanophagales archaeon]OYT66627.1 MAG: hypothetical protein B6V00_03265 [ANME-1 cluster archaeon ex4572_4]PXF50232.1 MAG: hypothetical protein C4B55_06785 [Methanophagales archaeon]HDN68085.1 hypothetical protein [Methanomicrobia archaeon]